LSRWALVIAMDGMYAGFAGAKTGHGRMTLNWRFLVLPFRQPGLAALAPLRRGHQCPVFAIRSKHTMESCQIDSGLGHQCGQGSLVKFCSLTSTRPLLISRPVTIATQISPGIFKLHRRRVQKKSGASRWLPICLRPRVSVNSCQFKRSTQPFIVTRQKL
jgi:hypothetical protein